MSSNFNKGLGQLEAYIGISEGVAFRMDNNQYWDLVHHGQQWTITGASKKRQSSKFWVVPQPSSQVMLRDRDGTTLAPVERDTNPKTYPVVPVPNLEDPNIRFTVFYKDNKVAFQASNGLFLGRVCKDFSRRTSALEASMFFPDDSCFFEPLIGDILLPIFQILHVAPCEVSQLTYSSELIEQRIFTNRREEPIEHTFNMWYNFRSIDRVFWNNLWGLGLPSSATFEVESAKLVAKYNKNNDRVVPVVRTISEEVPEKVVVPPMTEVKASLYVENNRHAALPIMAIIQKVKPDGTEEIFRETGAWKGLVYRNLRVELNTTQL